MNRRILLGALAGWLTVPAVTLAQAGSSRTPDDPQMPKIEIPSILPEPGAKSEPIIPIPQPLPKGVAPGTSISLVPEQGNADPKAKPGDTKPADIKPKSPAIIEIPKLPDAGPPAIIAAPVVPPAPSQRRSFFAHDNSPSYGIFGPSLPGSSYWVTPEYLLWKTSGMHVPALVTSSPVGTAATSAGVIGDPGTSILFGNTGMDNGWRSGFRLTAGMWLEDTQTIALQAGFLYLGQARTQHTFTSAGNPDLARPFFDVVANHPSSSPVAFGTINADGSINPALGGTITARTTSDLWGTDLNIRRFLYATDSFQLDGIVGFRYMRLRDTVATSSTSNVNDLVHEPFILPNGTALSVQDNFQSSNNFYGGQFGVAGQWNLDRWSLGFNAKLAMGVTDRAIGINGITTFQSPGLPSLPISGGLLALPTINGRYSSSAFSVIPEAGATLGYQVTSNIRLFSGYSFMYWSDVARAGDQINTALNTSQAPRTLPPSGLVGQIAPTFLLHNTGYWAQGVNFGVEFRW